MPGPDRPPRPDVPVALRVAAYALIVVAISWWLLTQLTVVLRPLLLAVLLGYVLLPTYSALRKRLGAPVAIGLIAGATTLVLVGLALIVTGSVQALAQDREKLQQSARDLTRNAINVLNRNLPVDAPEGTIGGKKPEEVTAEVVTGATVSVAGAAAGGLTEAASVGLYLLFLLLESTNFPRRVRAAYPAERAEQVLDVFGRVNAAIVSYLKAKVKASLVLAIPVGLLLSGFGVRFALLWAVLTFLCNFVPYLGSVVAYSLPVGFAFLQLDVGFASVAVAVLLLGVHVGSATVVEPMIIGRAVGLSPLVILACLSVWGLVWGVPGMFLAVPLTVVLKLAFENIGPTRPVARLLSGE